MLGNNDDIAQNGKTLQSADTIRPYIEIVYLHSITNNTLVVSNLARPCLCITSHSNNP